MKNKDYQVIRTGLYDKDRIAVRENKILLLKPEIVAFINNSDIKFIVKQYN